MYNNKKFGGKNMKKEYNKPIILISHTFSKELIATVSDINVFDSRWEDTGTDDVLASFFD